MAAINTAFEGEDVIITMEESGKATVTNMELKIKSIEISGGAANTEDVYLFGGATVNYQKPKEKYKVDIEFLTSKTDFNYVALGTAEAGAGLGSSLNGVEMRSSATPSSWRIGLWFKDASGHRHKSTDATIVVPKKDGNVRRLLFCNCKAVEVTTSMASDEVGMEGTLTFEFSATDSNGYANYFDEYVSGATTTALTVVSTDVHKGILTWVDTPLSSVAWTGAYVAS